MVEVGFELEPADTFNVLFIRPVEVILCIHFKQIHLPLLTKCPETEYL